MPAKKEPAMSPSNTPPHEVLDRVTGPRRAEADELLALCAEVMGAAGLDADAVVWASRIIGFGEYEYRYESGHGGRAPLLAFATGASKHTVYLSNGFAERWPDLVSALGNHRASKVCLYLTRLSDVDREVLRAMLTRSLAETLAEFG